MDEGKIAFENQQFEESTALLKKAQEVYPSEEGQQLLVTVKQEFKKLKDAKFAELLNPAIKNLKDRNWYKAGTEYEYAITSVDPEGHDIYYLIDWWDNTSSEWLGLYDSGEEITLSHIWTEKGNYIIKAKAKDTSNAESVWSDPITITMPKNKSVNTPFLQFLEQHPHLFPLLRQLLRL